MTDALPADRALNQDELDSVDAEWSDYRKDFGIGSPGERMAFAAGWGARHLHGYTPDPQARMMGQGESDAYRSARTAAIRRAAEAMPGTDLVLSATVAKLAEYAYDLGYTQAHGEPAPDHGDRLPELEEPEAASLDIEYGPAPAKRTLSEALLALDALVDEFASAIHTASLDVEDREGSDGEVLRNALGREAQHDERARVGSHVVYPITRIFARALVERLLMSDAVVLDIRPEVE